MLAKTGAAGRNPAATGAPFPSLTEAAPAGSLLAGTRVRSGVAGIRAGRCARMLVMQCLAEPPWTHAVVG